MPHTLPMPAAFATHPSACSGGTLAEWLYGGPTARRLPARSLSERLKMALDVARGMQALEAHEPQILHRDLKPSNVVCSWGRGFGGLWWVGLLPRVRRFKQDNSGVVESGWNA